VFTHPITKMSSRNKKTIMFVGSRARPVIKAEKTYRQVWADCQHNFESSQSYRPPRAVKGIALLMETECASCEVRTAL
jgi:hypothetical protein